MADQPYNSSDFSSPSETCDIIMQGGITSGVVYPGAIIELSKRYRFVNIGGTSAGAIAAAVAAAAEYGRHVPEKGFVRLSRLPQEAGKVLFGLFQPSQKLKPLFQILVAGLQPTSQLRKIIGVMWAAVSMFWWQALLGALPGLVISGIAWQRFEPLFAGAGLLLAIAGLIAGVGLGLNNLFLRELPDNDFGMCTGLRQPGSNAPGFTDWLADLIDDTAGRDPEKDPPLTFGDLADESEGRRGINLQMMTTNLMMRRPYTLPLSEGGYSFKREDFAKLFPARIMKYLTDTGEKSSDDKDGKGEYYKFPSAEKLPVVVAARMSLSFPLLISAVPLYARDFTLKGKRNGEFSRCLFSDGGLSSNFPIHFFDRMLPNAPTFGISLKAYDPERDPVHEGDNNQTSGKREERVWMPSTDQPSGGMLLRMDPITSFFGFLGRLLETAKDWPDNLQSTLAGYRDRIVHVYLKPAKGKEPGEGGLNIVMPPPLATALAGYGTEAGDVILDKFSLDEHRWRRFLVAMDRIDQNLGHFIDSYYGVPNGPESFEAFLNRYDKPKSYPQSKEDLALLRERARQLAELGRRWREEAKFPGDKLPRPKTDLRITPKP